MWRVWIEIGKYMKFNRPIDSSPSVWRVWIEIAESFGLERDANVTLRVEGVD